MQAHTPTPVPEPYTITPTPYPARTTTSTAAVNGTRTTATCTKFADKIIVTMSQNGRLGHWIHVPLSNPSADPYTSAPPSHSNPYADPEESDDTALLPASHLTATTILGGTHSALTTLGETLATQIASTILSGSPGEGRLLVVGLGLEADILGNSKKGSKSEGDATSKGKQDVFAELVGVVLEVL